MLFPFFCCSVRIRVEVPPMKGGGQRGEAEGGNAASPGDFAAVPSLLQGESGLPGPCLFLTDPEILGKRPSPHPRPRAPPDNLRPGLCPPRAHRVSPRSGGGFPSRPPRSASPRQGSGAGQGSADWPAPPSRSSAAAAEEDARAAVPQRGRGRSGGRGRGSADSALSRLELSRPRRLTKQPPGTERSARRGRAEGGGEGEGPPSAPRALAGQLPGCPRAAAGAPFGRGRLRSGQPARRPGEAACAGEEKRRG